MRFCLRCLSVLFSLILLSPLAWSSSLDVIAHRGLSFYAPESTLASYQRAQETGAAGLEGDIQMTKDGQLVIFHDDSIEKKSNARTLYPNRPSYKISDFTLGELQRLDFGSWFNKKYPAKAQKEFEGLKILTLADLTELAIQSKKQLYVEFKKADKIEETIERSIAELIQLQAIYATGAPQLTTVFFQSFDFEVVRFLSQRVPKSQRVYLTGPTTLRAQILAGLPYATVLSPFWLELTKDYFNPLVRLNPKSSLVAVAHKNGLKVVPWTLNNVSWIKKYSQTLGIDGVFTDRASDVAAQLVGPNSDSSTKDSLCAATYSEK